MWNSSRLLRQELQTTRLRYLQCVSDCLHFPQGYSPSHSSSIHDQAPSLCESRVAYFRNSYKAPLFSTLQDFGVFSSQNIRTFCLGWHNEDKDWDSCPHIAVSDLTIHDQEPSQAMWKVESLTGAIVTCFRLSTISRSLATLRVYNCNWCYRLCVSTLALTLRWLSRRLGLWWRAAWRRNGLERWAFKTIRLGFERWWWWWWVVLWVPLF
jgi:hypothetical protein